MREIARAEFGNETEFLIGVNGSFARREATRASDVDFFFLAVTPDVLPLRKVRERKATFEELLEKNLNIRLPASEGVFDKPLAVDKICEIGGLKDKNVTITRRMLLLLEGEWVFNEKAFHAVRDRLLDEYLRNDPGSDKICMFLLNDIIRYWRTICIDLEHKSDTGEKPREIRLIKLRFARLLLYASGVFAIGHGYGLSAAEKKVSLVELFGMSPIDRIEEILGEKAAPVLDRYAHFLEALDEPSIRRSLEKDGPESETFKNMSKCAGRFRDSLHCLMREHFANDNPTIRALLL